MKARVVPPVPTASIGAPTKLKHLGKKKKLTTKNWLMIFGGILLSFCLGLFYYSQSDHFGLFGPKITRPLNLDEIEILFGKVYPKRIGYYLTDDEKKNIAVSGGESSYGEILYNTTYQLLFDIFNVDENSVLHDFGAGVGKFSIQARVTTNIKKVVGTEMSSTRSAIARNALSKVRGLGVIDHDDESIKFVEGDFLKLDISDATHIYMCSTCFHEELMNNIYRKILNEGKPGLQVVTLVSFNIPKAEKSQARKLVYKTTYTVPMSWSNNSPGYHYVLQDTTAKLEAPLE